MPGKYSDRKRARRGRDRRNHAQVRSRPKHPVWEIVGVVAIVSVLILGFKYLGLGETAPTQADLARETMRYFALHRNAGDDWWLKTADPAEISHDAEGLIKQHLDQIENLVASYAGVDPVCGEIAIRFKDRLQVAVASGESVLYVGGTPNFSDTTVAFVPADQMANRPAALYYNAGADTLFVAAIDWPESLLAGVAMHELGHALKAAKGESASVPASPEWVIEELQMHSIEAQVLDAATSGRLMVAMNATMKRGRPKNCIEAVSCLTLTDLRKFDELLGCETVSERTSRTLSTEYFVMTAQLWANQNLEQAENVRQMVGFYNWMTSLR